MSKFIDSVRAELNGMRGVACVVPPLSASKHLEECIVPGHTLLVGYTFNTSYNQIGFCKRNELDHLQDNFVKALRRHIYGDIEERILRLERAMYEHDEDAMRSAMRDIKAEVFG